MPPKSKTFMCDQHASNISANLQGFYRDQLFLDISLKTKTDNLKAHGAVLSTSSDYFRERLCNNTKEATLDVTELGIDGATLKLVVDFMYSGTIELRRENVERLLTAADVLKMSTLKAACFDFIGETINVNNCLSIASMAKQQQVAELHKKAFEFALQHFQEVSKTEEYLQLTEEQLSELISSDDLCVNSEVTVHQSVMSWVKHDREHREKSMIDLLPLVRFTKLSKSHSERKKPTNRETLGFVIGYRTENFKFQTLNRKSNKWSVEDIPPPPKKRADYRATVIDRKLIVAGGQINGVSTNIVECLDLQTEVWTNLPPMRQARTLPGMAELNGDLYVVGGYSFKNGRWLRSVEKYDFRTSEWQELAPMHSEHYDVRVTVLGELLYAGCSSIECFNPAKNEWTQIPDKKERLGDCGMAGVDGHLYAVGGAQVGKWNNPVELFHPSTSTWTAITPGFGKALRSLRCVSWNNRLIAAGRYHFMRTVNNSFVEYIPEENEWKSLAFLVEHDLTYFSSSLFTFIK